jgi:hypothetical protein
VPQEDSFPHKNEYHEGASKASENAGKYLKELGKKNSEDIETAAESTN